MGVGIEAYSEVVAQVVVEMHATPFATLHIACAVVPHLDVDVLPRDDARRGQFRETIGALEHPLHFHGVDDAGHVESHGRAGTQQPQRYVGIARQEVPAAQVHGDVVVHCIDGICRLRLQRHAA